MRVALAGSGTLGVSLLRPLLESAHTVVAVVQNGRRRGPLKRALVPLLTGVVARGASVTGLARSHGIPIVWIDKMTQEELAPLRALGPDVLLVGGFSIILKRPLLDLPRIGCINAHSSLLPKHRGPVPFAAVLLANEAETGVTFHIMDEGIDTGAILDQARLAIRPKDTAVTLYRKLALLAGERVLAVLDRVAAEGLHGTPQDPEAATYEKKPTREQVTIRWEEPAEAIDRMVRACAGIVAPHFPYRGYPVYVTLTKFDPEPVDAPPGMVIAARPRVKIATGAGTLTIAVAFSRRPVPWLWPAPWNRPRPGECVY